MNDAAPVVIVAYDPAWPRRFAEEAEAILRAGGGLVTEIEHVGSTAVNGLAAKPILDLMAGVRVLADAGRLVAPLAGLGYAYVREHEAEIPERRYFRKGPPEARTHHLHVVEARGAFWRRHLLFRDALRADAATAARYAALKRSLAARHRTDRAAYTEAKSAFIEDVLARAGERGLRA